jgi:hypothetical protein
MSRTYYISMMKDKDERIAELEEDNKILTDYISSLELIVGSEKAINLYLPKGGTE